jgi:hypothetical protein
MDVHITEEGVALELLAVMRSLVAITVIMRNFVSLAALRKAFSILLLG